MVVPPDNGSRAEINARIHSELQAKGVLGQQEHRVDALVPRQDLIHADLQAQGRIAEESHSVPVLVEQDFSNKKLAANYGV